METYNATSGIVTAIMSTPIGTITGTVITISVFIGVLITIVLLSKNFRQFIYGGVVSAMALANYLFSRWVGVSTTEKNYEPIKWFCYIVGFIIVSIIIGRLMQKLKFVKNLEKKLAESQTQKEENGKEG